MIRSIVICQLVPEVTVEKPESQIKATTPLNADAQITAGAIGLLTAGPLGSLLGWWAIRFHKGRWNRWILTGFIASPVLILSQLILLGSVLQIFDDSNFIIDQASEAIEDNNSQHALEMLEEYVVSHPEDPKAWYLLGLGKQKRGEHQESIKDFTRAIELKPDYFEAYISRSVSEAKIKIIN